MILVSEAGWRGASGLDACRRRRYCRRRRSRRMAVIVFGVGAMVIVPCMVHVAHAGAMMMPRIGCIAGDGESRCCGGETQTQ